MRPGRGLLRVDVLDQGTTEVDVKNLAAVTDGQHGLRSLQRMAEDGGVGVVAIGIQVHCLGVPGLAVACWIDVCRAAGKDEGVQVL